MACRQPEGVLGSREQGAGGSVNDRFSLKGRVALVTGSSRGLGWEMARAFAQAGAHVAINGVDKGRAEARVAELKGAGLSAEAAAFDVTDARAGTAAVEALAARHGRLDILVSNAGQAVRKPLAAFTDEDWRFVLGSHLDAAFRLAREASKPMLRQRWGRIIVTASIMGQVARPTIPAYVAAKAGLMGMVKALAVELGPHGITCNAIAPGYFATDLNTALRNQPDFNAMVCNRTPLARWAEPHEIAGPALMLASDAGSYVNGHTLTVDGGLVASF